MKYTFGSGTMRAGGSLALSIMELDNKTQTFCEIFYFARHIYKKYKFLNKENIKFKISYETSLRLKYRNGIKLDKNKIYKVLLKKNIKDYGDLYKILAKILLANQKKNNLINNFVDYSNGEWRFIGDFLNFDKNFKSFLILRDPRSVVSSFKKLTYGKNNSYLNAIFNWLDCAKYFYIYSNKFSRSRFLPLIFENIHSDPESNVKKICKFLKIGYSKKFLSTESFKKIKDPNLLFSVHTKKKVYGYDKKRSKNWKKNLEEWEIVLIEHICKKFMKKYNYKFEYSENMDILKTGIKFLNKNKILKKRYLQFKKNGEGTNLRMNDPSNPKNWSSRFDPTKKFTDDKDFVNYSYELNKYKIELRNYFKI